MDNELLEGTGENEEVLDQTGGEDQEVLPADEGVIFAGKKFSSQKEAEEYYAEVEKKANQINQSYQAPAAVEDKEEEIDGIPISDLILTNPTKVLRHIRATAKDEAYAAYTERELKVKAEKEYWDSFYAKNKDLRGAEDIVKSHLSLNWDKYAKMDKEVVKDLIAKESRKVLNSILKAKGVKVEELSSSTPASLGASKGGPSASGKGQQKTQSFVDSIRNYKARRRA